MPVTTKTERVTFNNMRNSNEPVHNHTSALATSIGATEPARYCDEIVVQLSGTATHIKAMLERSFTDPSEPNSFAPAEDEFFEGNLSAGMAARRYLDPIGGFYRVRIFELTGGNVYVSIGGKIA